MNSIEFLLILAILILFGYCLYRLHINGSNESTRSIYYDDMRFKGIVGETFTLNVINEWISKNHINAQIYRYNTPKYETQAIDLVLNSNQFQNVGIEVKYRTINHIRYLRFEDISRFHLDGNRQSTKQLHEYIHPNNRLGLYAFVFVSGEKFWLYFLPHYILEQMIRQGKNIIYLNQITNHPHGYSWNKNSTDFINYIETEYKLQQSFLKFNS